MMKTQLKLHSNRANSISRNSLSDQKTKVLVTGATGLLGFNTLLQLLKNNYQVIALVRDKSRFPNFNHKNLTLAEGDITKINSFEKYISCCTYVVHCAAETNVDKLLLEEYYKTNVVGTENIIKACTRNAVKKLIYVGAANITGYGNLEKLGHENSQIKPPFDKFLYAQSKFLAQLAIEKGSENLNIVTIHPSFMIGPYDLKLSSGKMLKAICKNRIVFCPRGGKSFVNVTDVAVGIVKAIKYGENKQTYLLVNKNLSLMKFFKLVSSFDNKFRIIVPLSKRLLNSIGFIGDLLRNFGVKTSLSKTNLATLTVNAFYSNEKAKTDLNMTFTPIEKGIKDALNWLKKNEKNKLGNIQISIS